MTIRDDALWAKHISDAGIRERILRLKAVAPFELLVGGQLIALRKMDDGRDGRPTLGLKADRADGTRAKKWAALQERRGDVVTLTLPETNVPDPSLAHLGTPFHEWNSPEDAAAFDAL